MNTYLNHRVSALSDTVVDLISTLLVKQELKHRIALRKHTIDGQPLLEFRVIDPNDRTTFDFGVRQAWVYTHPKDLMLEFLFTTREDIHAITAAYPDLKNVSTLVFTTANRSRSARHRITDLYPAVGEILFSFLTTDLTTAETAADHKD